MTLSPAPQGRGNKQLRGIYTVYSRRSISPKSSSSFPSRENFLKLCTLCLIACYRYHIGTFEAQNKSEAMRRTHDLEKNKLNLFNIFLLRAIILGNNAILRAKFYLYITFLLYFQIVLLLQILCFLRFLKSLNLLLLNLLACLFLASLILFRRLYLFF